MLRLVILGITAVALPLMAVRLHFTFGPATYDLMRDARAFLDGGGMPALMPQEPPGYSLLLAVSFAAGLNPMLAGMLISLVAFVASVVAANKIFGLTIESRWVLLATATFLVQERLLSYATQAWIEGIYVAATLLALVVFGVMSANNYRFPARMNAAVCVVCFSSAVAAPFWLRHFGLLVPASVCAALLAGAWRTKDRLAIRDCVLVALGSGCLVLPLLVRNLSLTGAFFGTPGGLTPAYTFAGAFRAMLLQIGLDGIGLPFRVSEMLAATAPSVFLAATLLALASLLVPLNRRPLALLIAFLVSAHLLLVAYLESTTRLDVVSLHFVYPVIPLIALLMVMKVASAVKARQHRHLLLAIPAAVLLSISTAGSAYKIMRGAGVTHQQREFGYAPETTQAVLSLMEKGKPQRLSIATNRFGEQLLAHTSAVDLKVIPYDDVFNPGYARALGIEPWSEGEARRYFREHRTEWLAFFYGGSGIDQYMQQNAYGDFVSQVHGGLRKDLESQRIELADGLLVRVDPSAW